jgi:tetratricopeptide (TPR) repeat protein
MRARLTPAFILILAFLQLMGSALAQSSDKERVLRAAVRSEKKSDAQFLKLIELGNYYKTYNLKRADSIREVLTKRGAKLNESFRIRALLFSAEVNELRGNQDAYYRDVLACLPYLAKTQPIDIGCMINRQLGYYYCSTLNFKKADQYLHAAELIVRSARKYGDVAITNNYLALNFMYQNQKDSAIRYTNKAIQFARRTSDKQALTMCFNTQARIYDYFGQVELSVAKNINALQLATEMNNKYMLAKINLEIGRSQRMILDLDKAETSFKLSYDFAESIVDRRQMGLALSNLGTVYFDRRNYEKAIKTTENAIAILSDLQDFNGLGEAHDNLGVIHRERKEYTIAATNFNKALVYYESTGNKEKIAGVYHNVGTVFQKQKKYKNALIYLERSIAIRAQFGSKNQIYQTYRILSDVYGDIGRTKEAIRFLQRYVNYVDSNSTLQAATKIAELSEQYRMEQRERLIVSQRDSLEKQQQESTLTATKL